MMSMIIRYLWKTEARSDREPKLLYPPPLSGVWAISRGRSMRHPKCARRRRRDSDMSDEKEIIAATEKLLAAASSGDVATYATLSAESLTAIEPETQGTVITGLPFHKHMLNRKCCRLVLRSALSCSDLLCFALCSLAYVCLHYVLRAQWARVSHLDPRYSIALVRRT